MESQNNKGLVVALVLFIILSIALSGYIIYDKVFNNNDNVVENNNQLDSNNKEEEKTNNEVVEKENTIKLVDVVNNSDGYYSLFKVRIPKIVGKESNEIDKLNKEILNHQIAASYSSVVVHTLDEKYYDKGTYWDYEYVIENNVLAIYIYENVPEGGSMAPATDGGLGGSTYFYDIENDKIIYNLGEAAEKMKITDLDGAESYSDLNDGAGYMTIHNNKAYINYGL